MYYHHLFIDLIFTYIIDLVDFGFAIFSISGVVHTLNLLADEVNEYTNKWLLPVFQFKYSFLLFRLYCFLFCPFPQYFWERVYYIHIEGIAPRYITSQWTKFSSSLRPQQITSVLPQITKVSLHIGEALKVAESYESAEEDINMLLCLLSGIFMLFLMAKGSGVLAIQFLMDFNDSMLPFEIHILSQSNKEQLKKP